MRILFINSTDRSGGAAIIVRRLMKGLEQYHNADNFLLVRFHKEGGAATAITASGFFEKAVERSLNAVTAKLGLQYLFYPFSSSRMLSYAKAVQPDIISLHNTHGGFFATPVLEKLSRIAPIAWTLHDMWSFTGNAAHTFGNTSWKEMRNDKQLAHIEPAIGLNTGAWLLRMKKKIYSRSNLHIITPSVWLQELARQSPVFEGKTIHQIYNGVDETVFHQMNRTACREKLGLPVDEKMIMFSAEHISVKNPWKGGRDLLEILVRINSQAKEKINLLVVGAGDMEELNHLDAFRIFRKGYIHSEEAMSECLNAADVFIYPTRADNLPNVLVESIACGTPCISFDIGGVGEIIRDEVNGYVVRPFDFDAFAARTLSLVEDASTLSLFSANCTAMAQAQFGLRQMSDRYARLFSTIKSGSHATSHQIGN